MFKTLHSTQSAVRDKESQIGQISYCISMDILKYKDHPGCARYVKEYRFNNQIIPAWCCLEPSLSPPSPISCSFPPIHCVSHPLLSSQLRLLLEGLTQPCPGFKFQLGTEGRVFGHRIRGLFSSSNSLSLVVLGSLLLVELLMGQWFHPVLGYNNRHWSLFQRLCLFLS